jgi:hypothetical protein
MWRALLVAATVGWELYAIVAASDAGVGFLDVALVIPSACLLAIAWAIAWSAAGGSRRRRRGLLALWASFPVLGARSSRSISRARTRSTRSSARASSRASGRSRGPRRGWPTAGGHAEPLRVGLVRATYVTVTSSDEVPFLTADCGVVDQCGLAYRPRSRPTGARYAHITGPWYLVYEPF